MTDHGRDGAGNVGLVNTFLECLGHERELLR